MGNNGMISYSYCSASTGLVRAVFMILNRIEPMITEVVINIPMTKGKRLSSIR